MNSILSAEREFQDAKTLDANHNGAGEYGTLEQLKGARLLGEFVAYPAQQAGYRFTLVLSGDPARDEKEFFVYATPEPYRAREPAWEYILPGASWIRAFHPAPPHARRTFASDETGVIRAMDLGSSRPITRAEAQKWPRL